MGKAQEVERQRLWKPLLGACLGREATELQHTRLVLVQRQPELSEPRLQVLQELVDIRLALEAEDAIVGVPNDHHVASGMSPSPLVRPQVEDVVQVDIGKQRRDYRALRRTHPHIGLLPVFDNPGSEPLADQSQDSRVTDPVLEESHHPGMIDGVEGTHDTLPISKSFRRQCVSCAEAMPLKGKNLRCSGAASGPASCIYC
jgi:hypothetical protein